MVFLRYFGAFLWIFSVRERARSLNILSQDFLLLKIWSLELYQEIFYDFLYFSPYWGGWHMQICGRRLLRPERSSAARCCAFHYIFSVLFSSQRNQKTMVHYSVKVSFTKELPDLKRVSIWSSLSISQL